MFVVLKAEGRSAVVLQRHEARDISGRVDQGHPAEQRHSLPGHDGCAKVTRRLKTLMSKSITCVSLFVASKVIF